MSGFTVEIILKFKLELSLSCEAINTIFIEGLCRYFSKEELSVVSKKNDTAHFTKYNIHFFLLDEVMKNKLYSFELYYEKDISGHWKYLVVTDNSSSASLLFWDDDFFRVMTSECNNKSILSKAILLADPDYKTIEELFNHGTSGTYEIISFD